MIFDEKYWTQRYDQKQTQWDAGSITTPLKEYFDQLNDKNLKILIPGCGEAYEAEYLWKNGFKNVYVADISSDPLESFKKRVTDFPEEQLLNINYFELKMKFDLIIEQTFFCALHPSERSDYAKKTYELLKPGGKLVGVLFDVPLFNEHPPFGGNREDYLPIFEPLFSPKVFERCHNSIKPRAGRELFIILEKPE